MARRYAGALLAALPILAAPPGAEAAAKRVYYSVGTAPGNLMAGSPTVTIASGLATFSVAQPDNVGVGDEVTYGGASVAYLSGRSSATQYRVTTATGATPADVTDASVTQIRRAFGSLSVAVAGSSNASHLNLSGPPYSLVAADVQLNWPCYKDGAMNDIVNVTGWTTGAAQYIRIYTPTAPSEVGASQRHSGRQGTGFRLAPVVDGAGSGRYDILNLNVAYVRVEGIEIDGVGVTNSEWVRGVNVQSGLSNVGDIRVDSSLIHDLHTTDSGWDAEGSIGIADVQTAAGSGPPMRISNNIVYDITNSPLKGHISGIHIGSRATSYVYNNTIYGVINNPGCAAPPCGPAWGIYAKTWQSDGLGTGTVIATNNYCGDVQGVNAVVRCYDARDGATLIQSYNVSSDATASCGTCQQSKTAYSTYFRSTTAGAEDLHLRNYSAAATIWGSSGTNLASDPNLAVRFDVDGSYRGQPDIGADEFAVGCCGLSTTEGAGTLTVTGAGQYQIGFNTATGGGIDLFHDLAEDPTRSQDLAGGAADQVLLFDDEIVTGATYSYPGRNPNGLLHLIEATPARVKVRQDGRYHEAGGVIGELAGVQGVGDFTIYPAGRMAMRWNRKTTAVRSYTGLQLNFSAHYQGAPPLNSWTNYSEGGSLGGARLGTDTFVLQKSDVALARTDFLSILSAPWGGAHGAEQVFESFDAGNQFTEATWHRYTDGSLSAGVGAYSQQPGEVWNILTYFEPTTLVDHLDPAVTSRRADYGTADVLAINVVNKGYPWQSTSENTGAGDWFNEAEAAYSLDLNPALGLDFDIDGTLANPRYAPFFKIRQWRSLLDTPTVRLEGTPLVRNAGYRSDLKPLARAHKASALSWHSTGQDLVTPPEVGTDGGLVVGDGAIVAARYGNGLSVATMNNNAYYWAPAADFNFSVGAIEFWYQPYYDSTTPGPRMLWFNRGGTSGNYDCFWLEHDSSANLVVKAFQGGGNESCNTVGSTLFTVTATGAAYSWRAFDWVHIRTEWNSSSFLRLYVDGRLVASRGSYGVVSFDIGQTRIGSCQITCPGGGSSRNADGVIDEPHIYVGMGSGGNPETLAYAGLLSDGRESFASPSSNVSLLISSVGAGDKGEYLYFGADSMFRGLNVSLQTPGVWSGGPNVPGDLVWEYWNGTQWADLESVTGGFTDGTDHFTKSGTVYWATNQATDSFTWAPYSVNGGPDLYYVRVHLGSTGFSSYATPPVERMIKTDILLFQYCGDITAAARTFQFSPPSTTVVTLMSFEALPGDRSVELAWRTGSEVDNLGFHLYRSLSPDGPWTRLTSSLVAGQGFSAMGAAYAWRDSGLQNGVTYFYRLEDVDTKSVSTFHDPVSAIPQAGATSAPPPSESGGAGGSGSGGPGSGSGGSGGVTPSASCPGWALAQLGSSSSHYTCETHGDPFASSFRVLSRASRSALVELQTGGFLTARDSSGRVRALVPGFDTLSDPLAPALPLKRALLDGVVGRQARIGSIQARESRFFPGLVAAAVGYPQAVVAADGTVRPGRREAELGLSRGAFPRAQARLAGEGFQGEDKTLTLELMPLRYDASRGALVLSQRLTVRVDFAGAEPSAPGRGRLGRRIPRSRPDSSAYAFLATSRMGLHAISFEALFPGRTRPLDLSLLRLTTTVIPSGSDRTGPEGSAGTPRGERASVPFHVIPEGPSFGPGSRLFFLADAAAPSTSFSSEVVYALERGPGGARMSLLPAPTDGSAPVLSRALGEWETNRYFAADLLDAGDLWQWEPMIQGVSKTKPFALDGLDPASPQPLRLRVFLQGASDSTSSPADHHVQLFVKSPSSSMDTLVAETSFDGAVPQTLEVDLAPSLLQEGLNDLRVLNVGDTGVSSKVFLDRFEVLYPQTSSARSGVFEGRFASAGTAEVSGLTAPAALVDATSASWLTGYELSPSLRFRAEAGHRYLAVSEEALLSPRVFFPEPSARLRSAANQADYLLIAPRAFLAAAQPLLDRRASQGLSTFAASLEEITSSFGAGQPSGEALRDFLSFTYHQWTRPSPRYVLLLGDSNYDPRHFSSFSQPSPLPYLLQRNSYIWTASDPTLAALNGEDPLPDLAIGRLPATTVEQAQTMVAKILDWEDQGLTFDGKVALVADNPDLAGDFEADVRDIQSSFLQGRDTTEVFLGELGSRDVARTHILDAFNQGLALISYVGHGGGAVWASENMLNSADPKALLAQPRQPFMLTMNCLNGYFIAPTYESLAEGFLKAEGKGTIASFSPSGLSLDGPAHVYHRAVMAEVTGGHHERLGDALLAAQKAYAQTGVMPELLSLYHLFGDPAMRVR